MPSNPNPPPQNVVSALAPKTVGVPEAARLLGCSTRTIWRLLTTGDLRTIRIGRRTLVAIASIDGLVAKGGVS